MKFTTIADATRQTGSSYIGAVNSSSKTKKNATVSGQHTYLVYLAPAKTSGYNTCSHSTPECRRGCLATSGRAGMELLSNNYNRIEQSRIRKARLFYEQPEFFMAWLITEIERKQAKAKKLGFGFSVRLNGTSDIDWQNVKVNGQSIFEMFPDITFYDYTKNPAKFIGKPDNYHLTLSYTGRNWSACDAVLKQGVNVAVVFNAKRESDIPATFKGYDVINGDITDYRVDDAKGIIVGLKWKRIADKQAEQDVLNSCFVVNVNVPELELV
jgi:hypothetical protein